MALPALGERGGFVAGNSRMFELIEPPSKLIYSWRLEIPGAGTDRVSVGFLPRDADTEVIVTHGRIASTAARTRHESGWIDCLAGLAHFAESV
jgi:uncharacterized protein YndB with AHSA1/START domain